MQKERYRSWIDYNGNFELIDYESNQYITSLVKLDDLLNQQDKEIKQLKEQLSNEEQSHDLCIKSFEEETEKLRKQIKFESDARERFKRENQQLKQTQNQTAIRELEKVKGFLLEKIAEKQSCFDSGNYNDFADGVKTICEILLDDIHKKINKLRG